MLSANDLWMQATFGRPVFKAMNTEYTIEYGCKIERNTDTGALEFYNCRVGGDWYKKLTYAQGMAFYEKGFDIAALELGIETLESILFKLNKKLERKKDDKRVITEVENVKEKIGSYTTTRDYLRDKGHARGSAL